LQKGKNPPLLGNQFASKGRRENRKRKNQRRKPKMKNMIDIIEGYGFKGVSANMQDLHARYFDAKCPYGDDCEVKIVHSTGEIAFKYEGCEDWMTLGWMENHDI
jgi:hypothetical protein